MNADRDWYAGQLAALPAPGDAADAAIREWLAKADEARRAFHRAVEAVRLGDLRATADPAVLAARQAFHTAVGCRR